MRLVQKYGGSSVATSKHILDIAKYLGKLKENGHEIIVVVSAMGKTTDNLIKLANEITKNPDYRELDRLMSTGEQITISLMAIALKNLGYDAISLTGEQAGIKTKGVHTQNKIKNINTDKITRHLKKGRIVIVAGFQGSNKKGDITTLGRGGSDTSAVALAAALSAKCEIYTDIDGVYSIDPKVYSKAKKLKSISYEEMMELAFLGAEIMEARSIILAKKYNVEIYVGKSLMKKVGTIISSKEKVMEKNIITGISLDNNIIMVDLENIPTYSKNVYAILNVMENHKINIGIISQNDISSEDGSIAFTCKKTDANLLELSIKDIKAIFPNIIVRQNIEVSSISIVGIGLLDNYGIASKAFKVLSENNISFHQISTSQISLSLIIDSKNKDKLASLLAKEFGI